MRGMEHGLRVSVDVDKRQTAVLRAGGGLFLAAPFDRAYRMGQADRPGYVDEAAARARTRPAAMPAGAASGLETGVHEGG